jgi:hypothetical protein
MARLIAKETIYRSEDENLVHLYLERINPNGAGIDIGANFHFAAIAEDRAQENVRKFGPITSDLHQLGDWLTEHRIKTVVMESTGVYWIPVFKIVRALEGDYRSEHLFALQTAVELYDAYQSKITDSENKIEHQLQHFDSKLDFEQLLVQSAGLPLARAS